MAVPIEDLIQANRLTDISGVGETTAYTRISTAQEPCRALRSSGRKSLQGVLKLMSVPGLRPEKVLRHPEKLGITTAAKKTVSRIPRGSARRCKRVPQNLVIAKSRKGRVHLHRAPTLLALKKDTLQDLIRHLRSRR